MYHRGEHEPPYPGIDRSGHHRLANPGFVAEEGGRDIEYRSHALKRAIHAGPITQVLDRNFRCTVRMNFFYLVQIANEAPHTSTSGRESQDDLTGELSTCTNN